ncbi:serine/threonine-protein kinase Nek4-like isoform X2 [Xenia sp. Carnegie-2017]|uniref:serine/threonine-protein kinase Nek4-like isoform X2 n=1 Tax=Xenia sp. Carnegie-2017 TaxID=2897299 RepID=UPI001F04F184|nr:serine/threonine-protein kinase Nek4-like isoform X2 [Xenia sp. Carnegie-2017]
MRQLHSQASYFLYGFPIKINILLNGIDLNEFSVTFYSNSTITNIEQTYEYRTDVCTMPLRDYITGALIGKGTYGEVSLAKHKKDRKQYVIKRIDIHNASKREQKGAEQEANLLSEVRHPNIVSYKESFQGEDGFLYIVMAFCEGGDMYSRLKAQKGIYLEERQIVEWFVQIAMALQYLHDKRILHRDLKTQNIFLTKSKIIKVGDLGIARVLENATDLATTLVGTPYYMSPELFTNKPYGYKSDVWALGCCLYEMCTLKHAFNAKDMNSLVYKILRGKLPAMPTTYSDDLCDIIRSMLSQDPDKRPSVARLLRHSFIKKQIALFLEGTKNRQKKNMKAKDSPTQRKTDASESGKASDSGYSSLREAKSADPLRRKTSNEKRSENDDRVMSPNKQALKNEGTTGDDLQSANEPIKNFAERKSKDNVADIKNERKSRSTHKDEKINKEEGSGEKQQILRSRPLPPKPHHRGSEKSSNIQDNIVSRERRRFKVSKQIKNQNRFPESSERSDERDSVGLEPKVSIGQPISARERRRQRERESMRNTPSVFPSSLSVEKLSISSSPCEKKATVSSGGSDVTDGPSQRAIVSDEFEFSKVVENESSGDTDTEENRVDDVAHEMRNKRRTKESSDVNSLISALDTTLKLSDERDSPELDEEIRDNTNDIGDESVSTGRLRDRIEFLRRDCIDGLGEKCFVEACNIIDNNSEDKVQRLLIELMGRNKFEKYAGKIWQLKFCETFKRS